VILHAPVQMQRWRFRMMQQCLELPWKIDAQSSNTNTYPRHRICKRYRIE